VRIFTDCPITFVLKLESLPGEPPDAGEYKEDKD
jgi:hypothetical protein